MKYIFTGEVKSRRNLCLTGGFLVSLLIHKILAVIPQLYAGIGVYAVVDTAVAGLPAACLSEFHCHRNSREAGMSLYDSSEERDSQSGSLKKNLITGFTGVSRKKGAEQWVDFLHQR